MPGNSAAIVIHHHGAGVPLAARTDQALTVVADVQHNLFGDGVLPYQIEHQQLGHLLDDQPPLVKIVGTVQHLPGGQAGRGGPVLLDDLHRHRLPAPGVIDDQLRVDTEGLVELRFLQRIEGGAGDVAHREQLHVLQLRGDAPPDAPEIRQRTVRPQQLPILHLVQLRDAHAVLVRLGFLRDDVHGDLGQVQIRADASRRRDARVVQHVADHGHGELVCGHAVGAQIVGHVDEDLVDGVDEDVFRRDVFEVGRVDAAAVFLVQPHLRRRDDVGDFQRGVALQGFVVEGCARKLIPPGLRVATDGPRADAIVQSLPVGATHLLDHLEQAGPPRHAACLQRGGDREADRLFRSALVRHDQIGGQRIQVALHALDAGVEALGVNAHVLPHALCHLCRPPSSV